MPMEPNLSDSISTKCFLYISVKANTVLSYHFCRQDNTALVHRLGWHTRGLRSLLQHSELHCWARSDTIRMARARNKSQISPLPPAAHKFATFPSCHKINTSAFNTPWPSHSSWVIQVNLWHKRAPAEICNHNIRKTSEHQPCFPTQSERSFRAVGPFAKKAELKSPGCTFLYPSVLCYTSGQKKSRICGRSWVVVHSRKGRQADFPGHTHLSCRPPLPATPWLLERCCWDGLSISRPLGAFSFPLFRAEENCVGLGGANPFYSVFVQHLHHGSVSTPITQPWDLDLAPLLLASTRFVSNRLTWNT